MKSLLRLEFSSVRLISTTTPMEDNLSHSLLIFANADTVLEFVAENPEILDHPAKETSKVNKTSDEKIRRR